MPVDPRCEGSQYLRTPVAETLASPDAEPQSRVWDAFNPSFRLRVPRRHESYPVMTPPVNPSLLAEVPSPGHAHESGEADPQERERSRLGHCARDCSNTFRIIDAALDGRERR